MKKGPLNSSYLDVLGYLLTLNFTLNIFEVAFSECQDEARKCFSIFKMPICNAKPFAQIIRNHFKYKIIKFKNFKNTNKIPQIKYAGNVKIFYIFFLYISQDWAHFSRHLDIFKVYLSIIWIKMSYLLGNIRFLSSFVILVKNICIWTSVWVWICHRERERERVYKTS